MDLGVRLPTREDGRAWGEPLRDSGERAPAAGRAELAAPSREAVRPCLLPREKVVLRQRPRSLRAIGVRAATAREHGWELLSSLGSSVGTDDVYRSVTSLCSRDPGQQFVDTAESKGSPSLRELSEIGRVKPVLRRGSPKPGAWGRTPQNRPSPSLLSWAAPSPAGSGARNVQGPLDSLAVCGFPLVGSVQLGPHEGCRSASRAFSLRRPLPSLLGITFLPRTWAPDTARVRRRGESSVDRAALTLEAAWPRSGLRFNPNLMSEPQGETPFHKNRTSLSFFVCTLGGTGQTCVSERHPS